MLGILTETQVSLLKNVKDRIFISSKEMKQNTYVFLMTVFFRSTRWS